MIQVLSSETGKVVYRLSPKTRVCRYEPQQIATPMMPHASPYAPYGRWEFGWNHLFVVEERILNALAELRRGQNYFTPDVVLRKAPLGELLRKCGPGAVVLEDIKFNITVLGIRGGGALIIAVPRPR